MRPALAALALVLAAGPAAADVSPSPTAPVRLSVEGGGAWLGNVPDQALGPAGVVRARLQLLDRVALQGGLLLAEQPFGGRRLVSTLVPLAIDVQLDRAPVSPYLTLGWSVGQLRLPGVLDVNGPVLGAGFEAQVSGRLAFTAQATYFGLNVRGSGFPFTSALTAGVETWF